MQNAKIKVQNFRIRLRLAANRKGGLNMSTKPLLGEAYLNFTF